MTGPCPDLSDHLLTLSASNTEFNSLSCWSARQSVIVFSWIGEVDTTEIQGVFLILDDQKRNFLYK